MAAQKYQGGCHCGAVRYEATVNVQSPITCNCSICSKIGHWLTFVPAADFALISGQEQLQDYQFNKKVIHHYFCNVCGIHSFGKGTGPDGSEMAAINVRCLDDIDLDKLAPQPFDGKSR